MCRLNKYLNIVSVCVLFGTAALAPAISGAQGGAGRDQAGLKEVALSLEKALPAIVSSHDYRSASNTAFLLATARSRLDQPAAACVALSQSLEYYRKALAQETGQPQPGYGLEDAGDGMAVVREKFGCIRGHTA